MKWGIRKANKSGNKYSYSSMLTNRYKKTASSAKNKGNNKKYKKFDTISKNSAKLDKRRVDYARKTSVGKAIAQNLIFGPISSKYYQSLRAVDYSRGKAALMSSFPYVGAIRVGQIIGSGNTLNGKKNKKL